MDSHGDDVATSWPFDALTSSPPSLLNLQFASPPSPLWLFEEGAAAAAASPELDASTFDLEFSRLLTREFDIGNTIFTDKKNEGTINKAITLPPLSTLESSQDSNFTDNSYLIKEKLTQALRYFKESTDQHILVQVWAPVKNGDRCVLTTSGQPFVLDPQSIGLLQYRTISLLFVFSVDGDNNADLGLPGRVYRQKVPEWTPNVQYYSLKEYPRLSHAVNYNVRGTVALPVFDPATQSCVAVVELIMTSRKINYASEVDKVCKALEAVNLKSTEILDHPNVQIRNEGRQSAFVEILETLTTVCETHKLPLAQTWVPCQHRSVLSHGGGIRKSCSSMDDTCSTAGEICMSASDIAFIIIDPHMWRFRDACVEHHIKKGQGTAGKAFLHRKPYWVKDIRRFKKLEYPLVHYAIMFSLGGCFAICVKSEFTGGDEYVLEFFLPGECNEEEEQRRVLEGIIRVVKARFRSLKLVDGAELAIENIDFENELNNGFNNRNVLDGELELVDNTNNHNINVNINIINNNNDEKDFVKMNGVNGKPAKKRGKAEKMISLEVLQQYFSGSLKSAAKSLGVCPTTMKRICRHHGITRWPSRKINKVNRSLSKLKQVMESVQNHAPNGTFTLPSISMPLSIPPVQKSKPSKPSKQPSPSRSKSSSGEDSINSRTTGESSPVQDPVQLNGMLLEDSGSSKDLKTLLDLRNLQTVTIKASYEEDIIRFRFNVLAGVLLLKDEVASRLKLEIGMFEITYLDDDNEWVKLACDSDLEECLEITRVSSKNGIVRLSVNDVGVNLGSSCESTGGLNR